MKTSNVSSNKPVQSGGEQKKTEGKKPTKDFKELMSEQGAKGAAGAKKKPFSPLNRGEHKESAGKLEKQQASKEHERVEAKSSDRQETEGGLGGLELGSGKSKKSALQNEETPLAMPQIAQLDPAAMQKTAHVEKMEGGPSALKMEELQSIVQKCQVGINEEGLPEMKFQIQTEKLGSMDLNVSADGDKIKIDFVTEDLNTQRVLEENLKELSNMLQEKGLTLAQTNFSTRDQEKQEQQQQQQEQAWEGPMYSDLPTGRPKRNFNL